MGARRKWSDAEFTTLVRRWAEGETPRKIGSRLHRSERSVRAAAARLGLGRPGSGGDFRSCLACGGPFISAGRHNHICAACKSGEGWRSGADLCAD